MRTWTDFRGNTIQAELVRVSGSMVHLRNAEGKTMSLRISQLSSDDQVYVRTGSGSDRAVTTAPSPQTAETPPGIKKLFGTKVYRGKKKTSTAELADKGLIGLYFSAHWCGPCRKFSPTLVSFYNEVQQADPGFEIVLVSSDYSKSDMFDYIKAMDMPWLAIPPKESEAQDLKKTYGSGGIPHLVIIKPDGSVVSSNGRGEVTSLGAKALERWKQAASSAE